MPPLVDYKLNAAAVFPDTTTVKAYPATALAERGRSPSGSSVAEGEVSGGTVTLKGLTDGLQYVAVGTVSAKQREQFFTAGDPRASGPAQTNEKEDISQPWTFNAGITPPTAVPGFFAGPWNPTAATSGTDTTPAEKKLFLAGLWLPVNKTIKGIGFLVGSVGGTNKAVVGLFDASGQLLAKSTETSEGTTVGTAAEVQELDFTSTYDAVGPGYYFLGVTMNGNTARLRTVPKNVGGSNMRGGEVTLAAKNVLAAITPPTSFTPDKAPVCYVY